jgi:hypothetical protein
MLTYVSESRCPEEGIDQGVSDRVSVRVALETRVIGKVNSAQDEGTS